MKFYTSLIKTMNNINVGKGDETASRRFSNDSVVPPSTTASSRRSSMANSLPDSNNESHDYPHATDGTASLVAQEQASGTTSTNAVQARSVPSKERKSQMPQGDLGAPRTLNRESSWGTLSIDDI